MTFSACMPEKQLYEKTSKIIDITYECIPYYDKDYNMHYNTFTRFVLENGISIPTPENFNPCNPECYIGKTVTYWTQTYYERTVQQQQTSTIPSEKESVKEYEYICHKKYITSDNKYMIKYYTKTNGAIKTVQVSTEAYERAREGFYMETEDIEPFINQKK